MSLKPHIGSLTEQQKTVKNGIILFLALAAALAGYLVNIPEEATAVNGAVLNTGAQAAMGVLLFALILWMTEAVPFHITGLLAVLPAGPFQGG